MKNKAAQALGRLAKGVPKTLTKAERNRRRESLALVRPHVLKVAHFVSVFPHPLESNEYAVKWPMTINGKKCTYNPDYWCPHTKTFIECCTSAPNYSEHRIKWHRALLDKRPLAVFWWEGDDITERVRLDEPIRDLVTRPRLSKTRSRARCEIGDAK